MTSASSALSLLLSSTLALVIGSPINAAETPPAAAPRTLVMLIAEPQYETGRTLPAFAEKYLRSDFDVVMVTGSTEEGENDFDRIAEIDRADALLVSVRRRTPPVAQLEVIRRFVRAGKPVIGIRTASHAFRLRNGSPPPGDDVWPEWDHEVLGGNYHDHYRDHPPVIITAAAPDHPILRGVRLPFTSTSPFYKTSPLQPGAVLLLSGSIPGNPSEPVAWIFPRKDGGRTFYTSLGAPGDFDDPSFQILLRNGIRWAAGLPTVKQAPPQHP